MKRRVTLSGPLDSYTAFCNQLERCPHCARQFRRDLLQAHRKGCAARSKSGKFVPLARTSSPPHGSVNKGLRAAPRPLLKDLNASQMDSNMHFRAPPQPPPPISATFLLSAGLLRPAEPQLQALESLAVRQIYAVNSDRRVYEALREAMAEPKEMELWHGTSWQCVSQLKALLSKPCSSIFQGLRVMKPKKTP